MCLNKLPAALYCAPFLKMYTCCSIWARSVLASDVWATTSRSSCSCAWQPLMSAGSFSLAMYADTFSSSSALCSSPSVSKTRFYSQQYQWKCVFIKRERGEGAFLCDVRTHTYTEMRKKQTSVVAGEKLGESRVLARRRAGRGKMIGAGSAFRPNIFEKATRLPGDYLLLPDGNKDGTRYCLLIIKCMFIFTKNICMLVIIYYGINK